MEFQGRIRKVLPVRTGTSQRTGNNWKCLPFVFEYFEYETDRLPDSVVLEAFDEKVIANLQEGMEVRCGFGHRTREFTKQDGTTGIINDIRLYKIESVRKAQMMRAVAIRCRGPFSFEAILASLRVLYRKLLRMG